MKPEPYEQMKDDEYTDSFDDPISDAQKKGLIRIVPIKAFTIKGKATDVFDFFANLKKIQLRNN